MLKRLSTFTLIFILMVSTTGVNISVQWCGGEWMGVKINGISILTEAGKAMKDCCMGDDGGCDACHHVSHQYQITSQYMGAQSTDIAPAPCTDNWLQGILPTLLITLPTVEEGSDSAAEYYYGPPCHDDANLSRRGLRAPPVWA